MGDKALRGNRLTRKDGGRTNLLEELGRVEAEPSNRNRRAEIRRVHSELNKGYKDGGRTNLLEELGRVEAEPSNRNRRAEIARVHGELNRGYATGGRVGFQKGKRVGHKRTGNTQRENRLEELGRVDSERAWTKHGKRDLRLEKHRIREELKKGGKVKKDKKWIQKVNKSIKARGTKGKCTPITKPGCTGRAKALAKTFKKMAAKRKAKG